MPLIKIVEVQTYDFSYLGVSGTETRTIVADVDMAGNKTGRPVVTVHNANIVSGGTIVFTTQSACPNQGRQFPFGSTQQVSPTLRPETRGRTRSPRWAPPCRSP